MTPAGRTGGGLLIAGLLLGSLAQASADRLRNVEPGEPLPPCKAAGLDGKPVEIGGATGNVQVLLYLSAGQRQSAEALTTAHRVTQDIDAKKLQLIYMSADLDQADHFRQLRERLRAHEPFALDKERAYYGSLGLIVFPTTIIVSQDGKLLHVIAGCTHDYEHRLDTYCRHALGQFDNAELAQRLTGQPEVRDDGRARAQRHRVVAAILRSKGMAAGAIQELEKALAADPTCAAAVVELAEMLVAQGRLDDAETRVNELLSRQPDHPGTGFMLGLIRLQRGQLAEAEKLLEEALARYPDTVRVRFYLGQLYEQKGEYQRAAEHYRKALERALKER